MIRYAMLLIWIAALLAVAVTAFAQTTPPIASAVREEKLPLVYPEARIIREMDLSGDTLVKIIEGDPVLRGLKRVRFIHLDHPKPTEPNARPGRSVMDYYERVLSERGWKRLWMKVDMGHPKMVFAGPNRGGLISIGIQPRGVMVSHIDGTDDMRLIPAIQRLMQKAFARVHQAPEYIQRIEGLEKKGNLQEAAQAYRDLIAKEPGNSHPYLGLANLQMSQGKIAEAEENIRQAIALDPMNPIAHVRYSRILMMKKDLKNAEFEARQAVSLSPEFHLARYILAEVFESQGKFREAADEYRQITKNLENRPEAYLKLGHVLERLGQDQEAMASYQDALKLDPENREAKQAIQRLKN